MWTVLSGIVLNPSQRAHGLAFTTTTRLSRRGVALRPVCSTSCRTLYRPEAPEGAGRSEAAPGL